MIGAGLAALAVAVLGACAPQCAPAQLEPCAGAIVTVHGSDPVGCDVTPPQRLDVLEVTRTECDDMGGRFVELAAGSGTCQSVDY